MDKRSVSWCRLMRHVVDAAFVERRGMASPWVQDDLHAANLNQSINMIFITPILYC
jgi:hypothetical protein